MLQRGCAGRDAGSGMAVLPEIIEHPHGRSDNRRAWAVPVAQRPRSNVALARATIRLTMMKRRLVLIAITLCAFGSLLSGAPQARYDYYLTGSAADVTGATTRGIGLMGGGTDVDALFTWMSDRAGGGDFVVIRASGADGYNQYVFDLGDFDSVETLVLLNRSASYRPGAFCRLSATPRRCSSPAAISPITSITGRARQIEKAIHELSARDVPIAGPARRRQF